MSPFGNPVSINRFLEEFKKIVPDIAVSFRIAVSETNIPPLLKMVLFPVLEEILSNVRRHSRATQVQIKIQKVEDDITAEVTDNGCGFDADKQEFQKNPDTSKGLMRIQKWVRTCEGAFWVDSGKSGTTIGIRFPISANLFFGQKDDHPMAE